MISNVQKQEEQASWKDFFSGLGRRFAHTWHCLKNPPYVGKVIKATLGTLGMTAATALAVGASVFTRGRGIPITLLGLAASVPGWRGVGRQWQAAGDLSRKIWDKSFPAEKPAPPMPKMLPSFVLFGKKNAVKSAFSDAKAKPDPIPEANVAPLQNAPKNVK